MKLACAIVLAGLALAAAAPSSLPGQPDHDEATVASELRGYWISEAVGLQASDMYFLQVQQDKNDAAAAAAAAVLKVTAVSARRGVDWASAVGTIAPVSGAAAASSANGTAALITLELDDEIRTVVTGRLVLEPPSIVWSESGREHLPSLRWLPAPPVRRVHVVSMSHLDVGYNDNGFNPRVGFINNILNRQFQEFFPRAVALSEALYAMGDPTLRNIYTTHAWLVSLYLECPAHLVLAGGVQLACPSAADVAAFKRSVARGDIAWHAGPMNMQPEAMDRALWEYAVDMSRELDDLFGLPRKITLSQRDVPGMTRSVIPSLVRSGIKALSIGVNQGTSPPAVPRIFEWRDPRSRQHIIAMQHPGGYPGNAGPNANSPGGLSRANCMMTAGFDEALCFAFRTDDTGPPVSVDEVRSYFALLRAEFPEADVRASTFDAFTTNLLAAVDEGSVKLPVLEQEMGDTWLQGIASDPPKMAVFRAMQRARTACLAAGECDFHDPVFRNASRFLLKPVEHTWGLPSVGDQANWSNALFERARGGQGFRNCEAAWSEQRDMLVVALDTLEGSTGPHADANRALARRMRTEVAEAMPSASEPDPLAQGFRRAARPDALFSCGGVTVQLDGSAGHVVMLETSGAMSTSSTPTRWASPEHPLAFFSYHTYNETDFAGMAQQYDYRGGAGYDKPNSTVFHPPSTRWETRLDVVFFRNATVAGGKCELAAKVRVASAAAHTDYGAPASVWLRLAFGGDRDDRTSSKSSGGGGKYNGTAETVVDLSFELFGKTATRFAEASMLNIGAIPRAGFAWKMDKMGELVDPKHVMLNGSQWQHGVDRGVEFVNEQSGRGMRVAALDTPLACPRATADNADSPTPFPVPLRTLMGDVTGFGFNLNNNIWNTNYIFWLPFRAAAGRFQQLWGSRVDESNLRARFSLTLS